MALYVLYEAVSADITNYIFTNKLAESIKTKSLVFS